jgi:hypothetical protein
VVTVYTRLSVPPGEKKKTLGCTAHAGGFAPLGGAKIEQLKFKVPLKVELVTEKLPVALPPRVTVTGLLVNEKLCCGTKMAGAFVEVEGSLLASPE